MGLRNSTVQDWSLSAGLRLKSEHRLLWPRNPYTHAYLHMYMHTYINQLNNLSPLLALHSTNSLGGLKGPYGVLSMEPGLLLIRQVPLSYHSRVDSHFVYSDISCSSAVDKYLREGSFIFKVYQQRGPHLWSVESLHGPVLGMLREERT